MGEDYQCFVNVSIKSKTSFTSYYKFEFFISSLELPIDYWHNLEEERIMYVKNNCLYLKSDAITSNSDGIETIRKCFDRILRYGTNTGKKFVYLDFAIDDKGYVVVTHEEYNKFKADRFLNKLFGG